MKLKRVILFITQLFIILPATIFADVVYLKNGNKFEGVVKEEENSYWIDGILFNKQEVDHIEKDADQKQNNPTYDILNSKLLDVPIKTQITLWVLVKGKITEEWLRSTLTALYSSNVAKTGFKYHDSPTNVYIYAYESKEHYLTDEGQWIAMLAFGQKDNFPQIFINQNALFYYGKEPEMKFGFSEEDRKNIWDEMISFENKSYKEAEVQYPEPTVDDYNNHPVSYWQERTMQSTKLRRELYDKYKQDLAQKYNITIEVIKEIMTEGSMKNWPSRFD